MKSGRREETISEYRAVISFLHQCSGTIQSASKADAYYASIYIGHTIIQRS